MLVLLICPGCKVTDGLIKINWRILRDKVDVLCISAFSRAVHSGLMIMSIFMTFLSNGHLKENRHLELTYLANAESYESRIFAYYGSTGHFMLQSQDMNDD